MLGRFWDKEPWYAEGLRFSCTRCSSCCTGPPGYVWVDEAEIRRLAGRLQMPEPQFRSRYCRHVWGRISLRERAGGDCVLLGEKGCIAYEARPKQCRTWPFWSNNIRSPRAWQRVTERCPGAGRGRLYSQVEIERIAETGSAT